MRRGIGAERAPCDLGADHRVGDLERSCKRAQPIGHCRTQPTEQPREERPAELVRLASAGDQSQIASKRDGASRV